MPIHLCIVYGCFPTTAAELSRYNNLYGLQSQNYLLSGPLQEKFAGFCFLVYREWEKIITHSFSYSISIYRAFILGTGANKTESIPFQS